MKTKISPIVAIVVILASLGICAFVYTRLPTGMVVPAALRPSAHQGGGHLGLPGMRGTAPPNTLAKKSAPAFVKPTESVKDGVLRSPNP